MRLATFNIGGGRSLADGLVHPDLLRDAIAALDADVLAVQEIDRGQPRSDGLDLAAVVADGMVAAGMGPAGTSGDGMAAVASRYVATLIGTPGLTWQPAPQEPGDVAGPSYGIALASRWPVRSWHVHRFAPAKVRTPVFVPGLGWLLLADEPRAVLAGVVETPDGPITVAGTHLSFVPGWNVGQLMSALRWLNGLPAPRFLLGDLNLPPAAVRGLARAAGWRMLAARPTFPAPRPWIQLDHILVSPRGQAGWAGATARASTPELAVSDHRALVVELGATAGGRRPG
jgi:endonuclease/exonuclease/phosphatase family metal-dependent hydrolase